MSKVRPPFRRLVFSALLFAQVVVCERNLFSADLLPPGFRPLPLGVHALVGGKIVPKPGETIEGGTMVIRDGIIRAVGKDVPVPEDARVWDMKGLVIYAGFIDAYLPLSATNPPLSTSASEPITHASLTAGGGVQFYGAPGQQTDRGKPGPGYEVSKITPEFRAVREYSPSEKTLSPLRELGFTAGVIAPGRGIVRGTSALVQLAEENPNEAVIKPDVFQHIGFETHESDERAYPGSLMGVIASIRQVFFDEQHYRAARADYLSKPEGRKRVEFDPSLEALSPAAEKKMRVALEPGSALMVDRARRLAEELGMELCVISSGQEWRRPDLLKPLNATFIVPIDFPTLPKLPS
ncbi:MAG TPA: hypothetical protein VFA77_04650, partial [Candidatus Eisenbacteria bacterium]|nr:hypothetical protein [Candidatus Eisenbacteria bacterium]